MRKIIPLLVLSLALCSCATLPTGGPISSNSVAFYSGAAAGCLMEHPKEFCSERVKFMQENNFYGQYLEVVKKITPSPNP